MKKFKIGQKVKLVDRRKVLGLNGGLSKNVAMGCIECMERHFGKVVTIEDIRQDKSRNQEYVRVEENTWSWDSRFLQPIDEKPVSKVHDIDNFRYEDYILPCGYTLERVIENDKAVICFVGEDSTGKVIKTVAICQEGDEFDLHKGVEICMYKTLRKIADRNLRKF